MKKENPIYNNYYTPPLKKSDSKNLDFRFKVVSNLNDLMKIVAIRSAVFLSEQECPFSEEFDGNDFCALHIIGYAGTEPAACIRVRFFADFAKIERLAVRHDYRNTTLSFRIVRAAIELSRKKGYQNIYGHAQDRLVNFWSRFGAQPQPKRCDLVFSDFSYTEMLLVSKPHEDPISLESDPYLIIRSEGKWDTPGVLDKSSSRNVTSPLRNLKAA